MSAVHSLARGRAEETVRPQPATLVFAEEDESWASFLLPEAGREASRPESDEEDSVVEAAVVEAGSFVDSVEDGAPPASFGLLRLSLR